MLISFSLKFLIVKIDVLAELFRYSLYFVISEHASFSITTSLVQPFAHFRVNPVQQGADVRWHANCISCPNTAGLVCSFHDICPKIICISYYHIFRNGKYVMTERLLHQNQISGAVINVFCIIDIDIKVVLTTMADS